ncbi:MAG TPA: hypothetical protein VJ487_14815 [Alphaproteobacteria bacterium]|nr:hypothetical protein [Alphaproteobacteria bacterium]
MAPACLRHSFVAAALLLGLATPAAAQQRPCVAPLGWWESKGLEPFFINPNGGAPQTDCDFQLWSWSAFVHWIQNDPKTGQPLFLELPTYDDLMSGVAERFKIGPRTLTLKPRNQKPKSLASIEQAGSNGVLVDQSGRAVYYATHMDPIYFAFTQKYFGATNYGKAAPTLTYPIGATVFKTGWRIVQPGEDTSKVFTAKATIDLLESDGKGGLRPSGKTQADVPVELVSMHVVGVIKDHPEFAWATFEQLNNAPDLPAGMGPQSPNPVSAQSFTFYKGGTPAYASNVQPTTMTIDPAAQAISPITNVFRQFAFGGATPASRVADITSINGNFQKSIAGKASPAVSTVFANYKLIGTVWILAGTLKPGDGNLDSEAIGSIDLADATLETFVQGTGTNCFSCHNTSGGSSYPGKDINLSHIILSVLKANPAILKAR